MEGKVLEEDPPSSLGHQIYLVTFFLPLTPLKTKLQEQPQYLNWHTIFLRTKLQAGGLFPSMAMLRSLLLSSISYSHLFYLHFSITKNSYSGNVSYEMTSKGGYSVMIAFSILYKKESKSDTNTDLQ